MDLDHALDKLQLPFCVEKGKDCSMEVWHETLLVLFVGRIIGRCCC